MIWKKTALKKACKISTKGIIWKRIDEHVYLMTEYFILKFTLDEWDDIYSSSIHSLKVNADWKKFDIEQTFYGMAARDDYKLKRTNVLYEVLTDWESSNFVNVFFNGYDLNKPAVIFADHRIIDVFDRKKAVLTYFGRKFNDPIIVKNIQGESIAVVLPVNISGDIRLKLDSLFRMEGELNG